MNSTEAKVLADFAQALQTRSAMEAAFAVCTGWRDQATAKWGEEVGVAAFHFAADTIAAAMVEVAA